MTTAETYRNGYVVIPVEEYNRLILGSESREKKTVPAEKQENTARKEENRDFKPGKKGSVDHAKVLALAEAGWTAQQIADEMKIAKQSVYNCISRERKNNEGI